MTPAIRSMACVLATTTAFAANALSLVTEDSPPFNMLKADTGEVVGISADIVKKLMEKTKTPYTIQVFPWKRAYYYAQENADACVFSTGRNATREPLFKWVGPIAKNDWVFFAREDSPIVLTSLEDAKKYRVGTYQGDAKEEFLIAQHFTVESTPSDDQNPHKLANNRIDLWAASSIRGPLTAQKEKVKVKLLFTFKESLLFLACNKAVPDATIKTLNEALESLKKDGTVDSITKSY